MTAARCGRGGLQPRRRRRRRYLAPAHRRATAACYRHQPRAMPPPPFPPLRLVGVVPVLADAVKQTVPTVTDGSSPKHGNRGFGPNGSLSHSKEPRFRSLRFFRESTGTETEIWLRNLGTGAYRGTSLTPPPPRRRGALLCCLPVASEANSLFLGPRWLAYFGNAPCACRSGSVKTTLLYLFIIAGLGPSSEIDKAGRAG